MRRSTSDLILSTVGLGVIAFINRKTNSAAKVTGDNPAKGKPGPVYVPAPAAGQPGSTPAGGGGVTYNPDGSYTVTLDNAGYIPANAPPPWEPGGSVTPAGWYTVGGATAAGTPAAGISNVPGVLSPGNLSALIANLGKTSISSPPYTPTYLEAEQWQHVLGIPSGYPSL